MNLNRVIILGRVTAAPDLRTTPNGQSVASIGVATNRQWTDKSGAKQEDVEFHKVVLWGRQAEIASQFLVKGSLVLIEGRLQTRLWTDKQGQQRQTTEIMGENLQLPPKSLSGPKDFAAPKDLAEEEKLPAGAEDEILKSFPGAEEAKAAGQEELPF